MVNSLCNRAPPITLGANKHKNSIHIYQISATHMVVSLSETKYNHLCDMNAAMLTKKNPIFTIFIRGNFY